MTNIELVIKEAEKVLTNGKGFISSKDNQILNIEGLEEGHEIIFFIKEGVPFYFSRIQIQMIAPFKGSLYLNTTYIIDLDLKAGLEGLYDQFKEELNKEYHRNQFKKYIADPVLFKPNLHEEAY